MLTWPAWPSWPLRHSLLIENIGVEEEEKRKGGWTWTSTWLSYWLARTFNQCWKVKSARGWGHRGNRVAARGRLRLQRGGGGMLWRMACQFHNCFHMQKILVALERIISLAQQPPTRRSLSVVRCPLSVPFRFVPLWVEGCCSCCFCCHLAYAVHIRRMCHGAGLTRCPGYWYFN